MIIIQSMDCSKNNNTSKHNTNHFNTKIHNTSELMCYVVLRFCVVLSHPYQTPNESQKAKLIFCGGLMT